MSYEEYKKEVQKNRNASMFARDSYAQKILPIKEDDDGVYRSFKSQGSFNPDLDTPQGLHSLATRAGLGDKANLAIERAGGESQKFLSGGFVMDVMDILNASSYGVVGMAKGKGFVEGIKNRESFSDEDSLGQYGWAGKVAGFALDIVTDPLMWVAPAKIVTKIPGFVKGAELAKTKLLGELKTIEVDGQKLFNRVGGWSPVNTLGNKLIYGYAVDRKYLDGYEQIVGRNEAMAGTADNIVRTFAGLDDELMKKTLAKDPTGRFMSAKWDDVKVELQRDLSPKDLANVEGMYKMRDGLMDKLEELGVLGKETKEAHWGTYLKQSYDEFLEAKNSVSSKSGVAIKSPARVEGLTEQAMIDLGQVDNAAVLWGTTLLKQIDLVKKGELQKLTADGFSINADQLAEYTAKGGKTSDLHQVGQDSRYGALAGKLVTKEIWNLLKGTYDPSKEAGEGLVLAFKHMKVVWNPASHARNAIGAAVQNWWKLGLGPWRADLYVDAFREFKNADSAVLKQMKDLGFNERSGYIAELMDNYLSGKLIREAVGKQTGKTLAQTKKALKHADKLMLNSYGHMDNVAKVAAFKYGLKKGMTPEQAMKAAYEATFNYTQVTPFVHQMRRAIWGVPFITFSLKAVPLVADTLANAPGRISVFGKARNDLFKAAGVEGEQEAEALPEYMRDDMFVMRLPWKDEKGRSMYFDLSYIIPFGAIMNGEYLRNPVSVNPVLQTVKELSQNKTFSGFKIFNESDDIETVGADIFTHVSKIMMPPLAAENLMPKGYDDSGNRVHGGMSPFKDKDTQDKGPNERTFYQEMAKLAGASVSPYEIESRERQLGYKQKENLTKLLVENEIMKEFRNPYLPKDSELKKSTALQDNLYESYGKEYGLQR